MVKILVVDGSQLMGWLVDSLTPASVRVQQTASFAEARDILHTSPPHAAIFNIAPSRLPWAELHQICNSHAPRIPFLCCSAVDDLPATEIDTDCTGNRVLIKPIPMFEFRHHVISLALEARRLMSETEGRKDAQGQSRSGIHTRHPA